MRNLRLPKENGCSLLSLNNCDLTGYKTVKDDTIILCTSISKKGKKRMGSELK